MEDKGRPSQTAMTATLVSHLTKELGARLHNPCRLAGRLLDNLIHLSFLPYPSTSWSLQVSHSIKSPQIAIYDHSDGDCGWQFSTIDCGERLMKAHFLSIAHHASLINIRSSFLRPKA